MSDIGRDFWDGSVSLTPAAQKIHSSFAITSPYEGSPLELTVFVSCFNEENSIIDTLDTVIEAMGVVGKSFEILIIDDGSKDQSVPLIREFMAQHPDLNIVLRINLVNKGLAQNYVDGAFMGCGKYYRFIAGDNSETVETMVDVLKSVGEADIIVPYYVSEPQKNRAQRLGCGCLRLFLNLCTGQNINNYNGSAIHLRYNVMRWHAGTLGFSFQADLLCRLLDDGFTCKQVPCRALPRGEPKRMFTWRNSLSMLHMVLDITLRKASMRR